jgi:putative aldouronate transport system permease protein
MVENLDQLAGDVPPPLEAVKAAAIMVTTIPILLVYPFIQKYFVKGVMVGGLKG